MVFTNGDDIEVSVEAEELPRDMTLSQIVKLDKVLRRVRDQGVPPLEQKPKMHPLIVAIFAALFGMSLAGVGTLIGRNALASEDHESVKKLQENLAKTREEATTAKAKVEVIEQVNKIEHKALSEAQARTEASLARIEAALHIPQQPQQPKRPDRRPKDSNP